MIMKKTALTSAILSAAILGTGCQSIPKDQHEQALSEQRSQYEQRIQQLESEKQAAFSKAQAAESEAQQYANVSQTTSTNSNAADQLFPPNAQLGHCYSRVLIPAQYQSKTERVLVKPESESISILPATYSDGTERVLVKEASTKIVSIPATYKTVTERVMVKPAHTHLKTIPATYETVTERVLEKAAHTVWKRGEGFRSGALETKIDNGTGEIMCLVEVPATYKTVSKTILKTPERVVKKQHPAEYQTVTKRVLATAASTKTVEVPAIYKTINTKVLTTPEREVRNTIPAIYKNIVSSEKIADERLKWAEVLCEDNMTQQTIVELQQRLRRANLYSGPIDGIYGQATEKAVNRYAKRNGLPTGSRLVSLETAKHIGLKI